MSSSTSSPAPLQQPPPDTLELNDHIELTLYAIRSINVGDDIPSPLLYLLSFEKMAGDLDDNDRYKIVLSDGMYMQLAILPPKYADLLHAETLKIGSIKDANTVYKKINSHLEIVLTATSVLKRCAPDSAEPSKKTHFTPINEVLTTNNNTLVDVIGVVVNVREIFVIRRKDGSTVNKRIVKLNDMSALAIDVNLWRPPSEQLGNDLKNMHASGTFVILVVQNARVGYLNGKVINVSASTTFKINPSIPEADPLHLRGCLQLCLDSHSLDVHAKNNQYKRMSIASILECLSIVPETIETTITAVLQFIKREQFYYTTCPLQFNGKECKKKCTKLAENLWLCPRCQTQFPEFLVSTDTYNSESRIKVTIKKAQRLDFEAECSYLLAEIARMGATT
ncbi:replication protein A 70 kDa DNA-binding subunit A-like [Cryptomeria japonica]|uniref:replication protein A 70 kDa DNA-binding subunit A-like n=1 Tax=Cryptomeria japonica TaxID=3369 RepID=UPI0027DA502D|nr:replication protein A 70 kDa DNA-binding subunit A-like [Cryptomeria japonica]